MGTLFANMEDSETKPRPKRRDTNDVRAQRKREQDRIAQRATRERTKNRIAYLEQRLSSLEAGDKQSEIANLTKVIDGLRNDNTRLQSAMMRMRFAINEALGDMQEPPDSKHVNSVCKPDIEGFPTNYEPVRHNSTSSESTDVMISVPASQTVPTNEMMSNMGGLDEFFDVANLPLLNMFDVDSSDYGQWPPAVPSPFDYRFPPQATTNGVARDVDKWHVSNGAFISCLDSVKKRVATNEAIDLHVPFKAAIWGWDNVGPEAQHPVWAALRQVDQKVFGTWTSTAQRIALMYVCQTLIQYRENPTKSNLERVPVWFRPRPSQEKIQHPAVIDFLIWPGLRDRLVFEHEKYTKTGDFSAAFVKCFNFYWPYSDRDIFAYNPDSGRFEISNIFLEYAYNFKNWTMKPEFFKKFPEMQHDIAASDETMGISKASWS